MPKKKAASLKIRWPHLEFTNTWFAGLKVALKGNEFTLGKALDNNVCLDDPAVAQDHAVIRKTAKGYEVEDLDSQTGTFINGKEIKQRYLLQNGNLMKIGPFELKFHV